MQLVEQFISFLKNQKDQPSKATIKNYKADINQFIRWFEERFKNSFDPNKATSQALDLYKESQSFSASSMERHLSSFRKFFNFLKLEGLISQSPFEMENGKWKMENADPYRLKDFKDFLYVYNASHLTIKNYIIDIKQFFKWAQEVSGIENAWDTKEKNLLGKIDSSFIEEYKNRLLEQEFLPSTVNRKLSSLRKYFNWAQAEGLLGNGIIEVRSETSLTTEKGSLDNLISDNQNVKDSRSKISNFPHQEFQSQYSPLPPIRLVQKFFNIFELVFDYLVVFPLAKLGETLEYAFWQIQGKPVFSRMENGKWKMENGKKRTILNSQFSILNLSKAMYAPLSISTKSFPWHKKAWHHLRHTRPNWYRTYHSYPITHYFHLAILIIFMTAVGFAMYNAFAKGPQNQSPAFAAPVAPPRILSFQGRLTDSSDNPVTTAATAMRMAIYNSPTATDAALLWQEIVSVSPDTDGIFSVLLGNNTAITQATFAQNATLYLGVTVGSTPELTPRQQLATVAFATNAEVLQGLPPVTDAGVTTNTNAVLALNSSGTVSIAGTATTTFQAASGQLTITGKPLVLQTNSGTAGNIQLAPDGFGTIDFQKPIQNSSNNNNISTAVGAVEVDDLLAILATSSGQSALTINQTSTGPLISASASGVAKFTVDNSGNGYFAGNVGIGTTNPGTANLAVMGGSVGIGTTAPGTTLEVRGATAGNQLKLTESSVPGSRWATLGADYGGNLVIDTSSSVDIRVPLLNTGSANGGAVYVNDAFQVAGNITPEASGTRDLGSSSLYFANVYANNIIGASSGTSGYWQRNSNSLSPTNITDDLLLGATSTGSAKFAFINMAGGTPTASISGNLSLAVPTTAGANTFNLLNNSTLNFQRSPGGDAGLAANSVLFLNNNGNVGIGTTAPGGHLNIAGNLSASTWGTNGIAFRNDAATFTDTSSSGTVASAVASSLAQPTFAASSATTYTAAANLYIANAPAAGTNVTITNPYALWVDNGDVRFDGNIRFASKGYIDANSDGFWAFINQNYTSNTMRNSDLFGYGLWGLTHTDSGAAGTIANGTNFYIQQSTIAALNAITVTNASTVKIEGAPVAGTNVTITNPWAFWVVAGNSRFGGNVGIQNATPLTALDVTGSASLSANLSLRGSGTAHTFNILDNGTLNFTTSVGGDAVTNSTLFIKNGGAATSGNVGIGTTSPGSKLVVNGAVSILGTSNGAEVLNLGTPGVINAVINTADEMFFNMDSDNSQTGARFVFATNRNSSSGGTELVTINDSGNVGIGTGTPLAALDVRGTSGTLPAATISATSSFASLIVDNAGVGDLFTASKSGATKFVVTNAGNVGIGTTNPLEVLGVSGNASVSGTLAVNTIKPLTGALNLQYKSGLNAWTNALTILDNSGSVGIGTTSPQYALDIVGNSALWQSVYGTDDGLVLSLPFSEGTGTKAYDRSPYGNDGTLTLGPTWTTGKYGNALSFDGTNDAVTVSDSPTLQITGGLTISLWLYVNSFTAGQHMGVMDKTTGQPGYQLYINQDAHILILDTSGRVAGGESVQISSGQWYHIVVTSDTSFEKYYVDGVLKQSIASDGNPITAGTNNLLIGDLDSNASWYFNGKMDEIRIYNRTLSADEVKTQYLGGLKTNTAIAMNTATTAQNLYGLRGVLTNTGVVTTGTDANYGSRIDVTRTGATGGTINTYGQYIALTADNAGAGTSNSYGLYVDTSGSTADNNYSAYFSGNVGIGTTAPSAIFTIGGSSLEDYIFTRTSGGTTVFNEQGADIDFRVEGDTEPTLFFTDAGTDSISMFRTPSSDAALTIGSTIHTAPTNSNWQFVKIIPLNATTLVGTVDLATSLHVSAPALAGVTPTKTATVYIEGPSAWGSTNYSFWVANGVSRFDGKVGIGTTAPLTALDVTGSASLSANLSLRGSGTAHTFNILDNGTLNFTTSVGGDAVTNSTLFIKNGGAATNGNVGIGTTAPLATLDIRGLSGTLPAATVSATSSFASLIVDNSGVGDLFTASKSGATKFVIQNSGNVGIATASAYEKLEVYGGNILVDRGHFKFNRENAPADTITYADSGVAGNLDGSYSYGVSFVTASGESGGTSSGTQVTVTNKKMTVSNIPLGSAAVIARKIYRTAAGGANPRKFVATISDNTTTTYTDNLADAGLGAAIPAQDSTAGSFYINGALAFYPGDTNSYNFWAGLNAGLNSTGQSTFNTGVGVSALKANTSGSSNTAVGALALTSNTTGGPNDAFGFRTLFSNDTGGNNVGLGSQALYRNTTGNNNVGIGANAEFGNNGGHRNTIVGSNAFVNGNNSHSDNIGIGYIVGDLVTTGSRNVLIGSNVATTMTTGSDNILIGYNVQPPAVDSTYRLNIGGTIYGDLSNKLIGIGNATPLTALDVTGSASLSANFSLRGSGTAHTFNILDNGTLNFQRSPGGDAGLATNSVLYLNNSGNVGIGTTSPLATLDLRGNLGTGPIASFSGRTSFAGLVVDNGLFTTDLGDLITASSSAYPGQTPSGGGDKRTQFRVTNQGTIYGRAFYDIDNSAYFLDPASTGNALLVNGNIGIGTTSPGASLHAVSATGARWVLRGQTTGLTNDSGLWQDASNNMQFAARDGSNVLRVVLDSNSSGVSYINAGNVGIGTTNPLNALVISNSGAEGLEIIKQINYASFGSGPALKAYNRNTSAFIPLYNDALSYGWAFSGILKNVMDSSGSVGIGTTSPLATLDVRGTSGTIPAATVSATSSFASLVVDNAGVGDLFTASKSGATKFVVTNAGNVGIGTNVPGAALAVSGGNNINERFPDGLIATAVNTSVTTDADGSPATSYPVTTGKTFYITNSYTNSAGCNLQVGSKSYTTGTGIHSFGAPLLAGSGVQVQASTGANCTHNVNGFEVAAGVTAKNQSLTTDIDGIATTTYTVTTGKTFYITNYYANLASCRLTVGGKAYTTTVGSSSFTSPLLAGSEVEVSAAGAASCTGNVNGYETKSTGLGGADVAEQYFVVDNAAPGDIISMDSLSSSSFPAVSKTSKSYDQKVMGVITTNPGITLADDTTRNSNKPTVSVALNGRVPVKVSAENGPIQVGDPLTSSSTPGVAMKATKSGPIVAKALEQFNCSTQNNADQPSSAEQTQNVQQGSACTGKVLAFINVSWYDPDVYITSTGDYSISKLASQGDALQVQSPAPFVLKDPFGNVIDKIGAFAELAVANLKAGFINAQEITTNSLAVTADSVTIGGKNIRDYIVNVVNESINNGAIQQFNNRIISPIASIDSLKTNFISPLASDSTIAIRLDNSQLSILNSQFSTGSAVAVIDNAGNASFAGTLNSSQLTVNNDATIGGTLRAKKIIADQIEGLNIQTSTLSAQYITNNYYDNFGLIADSASSSGIPNTAYNIQNTGFVDIASFSGQLAYVENLNATFGTFTQGLVSLGPSSFSDLSVVNQLSISGNLVLADNSINVLGSDLKLQPLKQGGLSIMGGLVYIDTFGNIKVGGDAEFAKDVTVKGVLSANIISPIPGSDLVVRLNNESRIMNPLGLARGGQATDSASIRDSQFIIHNSSGSAVLVINQQGDIASSGSATFGKLNLRLVQPALAISNTQLLATGSAGVATISAHQTEVTINNNFVTDKSLIYITPVGEPSTNTPYLMRQIPSGPALSGVEGSFTAGIQSASNTGVPFNWLIIN